MGNRFSCKQTFQEWCEKKDRQDLLDAWDYEKNDKVPDQVASRSGKKFYFKDPITGESVLKTILSLTDSDDIGMYKGKDSRREDLTGQKFNHLTVLGIDWVKTKEKKYWKTYWQCECDCGAITVVDGALLKNGETKTCGNKAIHFSGSNNPLWQGGDKDLRKTSEYKKFRDGVLEKDDGRCIICGSSQDVEVHHIYPFASHPSERYKVSCGATLCKKHHGLKYPYSFHKLYGSRNFTPDQFEDYVNYEYLKMGRREHFDVYEYMNSYDIEESDDLEIDSSMLVDLDVEEEWDFKYNNYSEVD